MSKEEPSPLEMIEMVGETIFASARRGDLDSVRRHCLDSDFDPNVVENNDGHGEVAVQDEEGARSNASPLHQMRAVAAADTSCRSPGVLHIAAMEGHLEVLAFIAQLDGIKLHATDCGGQTAMHLAARGRHAQAVFLLLELGGVQLAERGDADGTTALQIAALLGETEIIRVLIQAGCSPSGPDHELVTPLHQAAREGKVGAVMALLRMGGDLDCIDIDCATPLIMAAAKGHADVVECLLAEGAVATREDAFGRHALQAAVDGGHVGAACLLAARHTSLRLTSLPSDSEGLVAQLVAALPRGCALDLTGAEIGASCAAVITEAGSNLAALNLCGNNIIEGERLSTCTMDGQIRSLDLSHNRMSSLPDELSKLNTLSSLSVSSNALTSLPLFLATSLQVLDASTNLISKISDTLPGSLPNLVCLALSHNSLSSLPCLSSLSSLQILNISHNSLSSLPFLPPHLCSLDASNNSLSTLPDDFLSSSSCLTRLALENNALTHLPVSLASSPLKLHPEGLSAHLNPLSLVPEPFRGSSESLMGYLSDLVSGVEQVLFIRVMLIGNAAAGKTSLLRCLSDKDVSLKSLLRQPRLPDTGGATLGIQVEKLERSVRVCDAMVRLQFWDFAGQACYMVGHSLFLSDRVLPVYVFDATNDTLDVIEQANRWLDSVVLSTSSSSFPAMPSASPQTDSSQPANACPLVLVGTRVESGKVSREACAYKMENLEEALRERVAKLYGRTVMVRGKFGVSSSTRECYDCRMRGSRLPFSFSSLLSKIGQSALGVLYTDREYPRALVPVSYVRLREALLSMPESRPVIEMADLVEAGRNHAGITQREHLVRALAMLRSWGAFMHFCDSEALAGRAFQMQWCIELIYTLFVCAHWRTEGEEGRVSMEGLRGKVDVEGLELADPGGRLLRRGLLSGRAARVMFGRVATAAGLDDTHVCLEVLGSMGIVYSCGGVKGLGGRVGAAEGEEGGGGGLDSEDSEGVYLVPSLFNNAMPKELKASLRAGKMAWTTQREYRFNILPLKLASRLTVKLCSAADLRSGETSVSFWEDGAWVQMSDGAAIMIDSHQGGRLLIISTIQPAPVPAQGGGGEVEVVVEVEVVEVERGGGGSLGDSEVWRLLPRRGS